MSPSPISSFTPLQSLASARPRPRRNARTDRCLRGSQPDGDGRAESPFLSNEVLSRVQGRHGRRTGVWASPSSSSGDLISWAAEQLGAQPLEDVAGEELAAHAEGCPQRPRRSPPPPPPPRRSERQDLRPGLLSSRPPVMFIPPPPPPTRETSSARQVSIPNSLPAPGPRSRKPASRSPRTPASTASSPVPMDRSTAPSVYQSIVMSNGGKVRDGQPSDIR